MMAKKFDVGVIGGGIIGCAVAYYLSRSGTSVVLFEKNHICSGASSANQGGLAIQVFDLKTIPLALASAELYRGLSDELGYDIEYHENGSILVTRDAYQVPVLRRRYDELKGMGLDVDLWDDDQLRRFPCGDTEPFLSVIESHFDGQVNPFRSTYGFAFAAKRQGVRILTNASVAQIKTVKRRVRSVVLEKGEEFVCGNVVCAAGPWSRQIGQMVGLDIPVEPQRGQIIVTEQVADSEYPYILDGDYLTTAYGIKPEGEDEAARIRHALGIGGSYAQDPAGNWTIGSSRDMAGFVRTNSPDVLKGMARHLLSFFPGMKDINCIRFFAGFRPYCVKDGHPILGRAPDLSGFYIATGHAGEGIALAPATGKLIAEEITIGKTSLPMENFRYERFVAPH
ncbi:MAG: FAD-binding oxidoreductase [Desulfobacteraceae bacterium]|nr:MAG: FAD-binding oxidoreductase [Desulfobacteraceae bacterium]